MVADIDRRFILACAVTPANRPEEEAAPEMHADIGRQKLNVSELHIDRGYVNASTVSQVLDAGGEVLRKPWVARNSTGLFQTAEGLPRRHAAAHDHLARRRN
ncbi:MAG: hypothetical protein KIT72_07585 [Polyangiaceae bacterium]|nr:hypothetical protein [Polyangiaceae bacterium]